MQMRNFSRECRRYKIFHFTIVSFFCFTVSFFAVTFLILWVITIFTDSYDSFFKFIFQPRGGLNQSQ